MDDDAEPASPPLRPKMSLIPSWVMLGFALGVLFVVALPSRKPEPIMTPPERLLQPVVPPARPRPLQLTTIEAVFAEWGAFAVWENETSEIGLWNTELNNFVDFYEVRRFGETLYFRTIPKLTRRIVSRNKPMPENCPLVFTETDEHYREWLLHGSKEPTADPRPLSVLPLPSK